jgi:translation initiation factor 6
MAGVVTNKGGVVNPNTTDWEMERLKKLMRVEAEKGTVNFGSDMVGAGIVANSKGYIAGRDTTGFELGVIESALNFL